MTGSLGWLQLGYLMRLRALSILKLLVRAFPQMGEEFRRYLARFF